MRLDRQKFLHKEHRAVMTIKQPFYVPDEFYPTEDQDFLVMVCLPREIKNCLFLQKHKL